MHLCTGVAAQQPTSQHGGVSYIVTPVQQQHTHVQGSVQSPVDLTLSALLTVCRVKGHSTSAELVWQERLRHACVHRLGAVDCAVLQPSIYMHTHACAGRTCAHTHTHTHTCTRTAAGGALAQWYCSHTYAQPHATHMAFIVLQLAAATATHDHCSSKLQNAASATRTAANTHAPSSTPLFILARMTEEPSQQQAWHRVMLNSTTALWLVTCWHTSSVQCPYLLLCVVRTACISHKLGGVHIARHDMMV
jgi:hypothetical protein